jgi:hypothetical protein
MQRGERISTGRGTEKAYVSRGVNGKVNHGWYICVIASIS